MKITRKSLIVVAVVLALAVMATPVIASSRILRLEQSQFTVTFQVSDCTVTTTEYSTKHILFGRPVASTNVGTVTASGNCVVEGAPFAIPTDIPIPFAVVDVRNPLLANDIVVKSYAMVAYLDQDPGLSVPTPVQAGAYARLVRFQPPLKYIGYVYMYTGPDPDDYLIVPFVAQGDAVSGFDVKVLGPDGLDKLPRD